MTFRDTENANEVAEMVLKGNPKRVLILTSESGLNVEGDGLKVLSDTEKSTLLAPLYISGISAAFYNICKFKKITCKVFCSYVSNHTANLPIDRFRLPMESYNHYKSLKILPDFPFQGGNSNSMYV
eukprot:NODE_459_length_7203_cov_0.898226.p8 type:complete len:126 gc:universal NODE_459_length_7203_cov_0.898226:7064-6687(-)